MAAQEYGSAWQPRAQAGEPRVTQGCQSLLPSCILGILVLVQPLSHAW